MTKKLNHQITVIGFKNAQIDGVKDFLENFRKQNKNAPIQFFDAKNVAGSQHLYFAALNAQKAFEKKRNISNNLAVEVLLYASAQRQITKAVEMLGLKHDSSEVAALIIAENSRKKDRYLHLVSETVPGKQDNSVLELTATKIGNIKKLFQISDIEFEAKLEKQGLEKEALTDLIIERMALLGAKG
jgi:KEOPS complex subunit Cgi121